MTRLLVCGGRHYGELKRDTPSKLRGQERVRVWREITFLRGYLDVLHAERTITVLIHGGASGADRHAAAWAASAGIPCMPFFVPPEEWQRLGKAAGPQRNARMLAEGKPDACVAFEGGRGTRDMIRQARGAGIEPMEARP